ncbi:hypothetical protein RFI_19249 [Reticulomyxa filosa]|uniref:Uncharacterized protein n=1 Tax=Reticulomyxa filosa TaxID=46433 RepID=X6MY85_RETFI|nr:hypothetical protein RFI_19249 [Reticulomyxa filosa]|eukprot:ETO18045.1 hypothetical protein RFI_19249 [Reticulomyxa filosa]
MIARKKKEEKKILLMQKLKRIFTVSGKHAIQPKEGASTVQTTMIMNECTRSGILYTFLAFSAMMIEYNVYLYRQSYLYDVQDKQAVDMLGLRKMASIMNYTNTCRGQTNNHFETQNLEELKAIIQYWIEKGESKDIFGKQKNIQIFEPLKKKFRNGV